MKRRFQNRLAESNITLPAACVVATLLWWLPQGTYSTAYMHAWLACTALTYFCIEATTAHALLRVRSQMPTALLLFVMAACGFMHDKSRQLLAALALLMAIHCLLRTSAASSSAEDIAASRNAQRPQAETFHAFAALSLGSLLWPPLLLLALPLLWSQLAYLRTMSWRCLGAAVIGCATPYFFWGVGALAAGQLTTFTHHCAAVIAPIAEPIADIADGGMPLAYTYFRQLPAEGESLTWAAVAGNVSAWAAARVPKLAAAALVALLALTGFVHYARNSYDDKINVRISHQTFLATQVATALWLTLQPRQFIWLLPLLLLTSVPSASHFIAFTRTWLTNAWVLALALLLVITAVLNLIPGATAMLTDLSAFMTGSTTSAAEAFHSLLDSIGIAPPQGS